MAKNKAVFLDRDGVINKCILRGGKLQAPYELAEFEFLPGVYEAIKLLKDHNFLIVVVTNQPDVSRGWVAKEKVEAVNLKVMTELQVNQIKTCFHDYADECECRKPKAGMLMEAAAELDIDLKQSFMMGDRYTDIAAGVLAGCQASILIGLGDSQGSFPSESHRAISLLKGAEWLVKEFNPSPVK